MYKFEKMFYESNTNTKTFEPASSKPSLASDLQIDFKMMFPVRIKTDKETLTFMWNNEISIEKMFVVTSEAFSIPADSFYLFFAGKKLHSSSVTLKEMNISTDALIHCIFKLRGGMLTESSGRFGSYKVLNSF